ncbi:MAG: hypothetical protein FRX48_01266 [Lasallia pustulata]|uniref:Uncharacterized protein n=1 Tax=Lasallia pustulata TaxID=136370 RepID=A0A5M8PYH9_9LECA|nr:MAG: hypothetical protein FRX48_01266 [Lasallia pustulata]
MEPTCPIPTPMRWHSDIYNILPSFSFQRNCCSRCFPIEYPPSTISHLTMRVSSLLTFSVLALVAPITAAPQLSDTYDLESTSTSTDYVATGGPIITAAAAHIDPSGNLDILIEGASTRTFHISTGGAHFSQQSGQYKSLGTGSRHHHHATGLYSFVAGTGVVPTPTMSLSGYDIPLLGLPKTSQDSKR